MYSNEQYLLELLAEHGAISAETVESARAQIGVTESVLEHLVNEKLLTYDYIAQVAAASSGLEFVDLNAFEVDPPTLAQAQPDVVRRLNFLPIGDDGYSLQVAVADPFAMETLDSLSQILGRDVSFFVAAEDTLQKAIAKYYPEKKAGGANEEAPIIELIDNMFNEAHKMRASDIHIEPMEDRVRFRYRVDGRLIETANHPKKLLGSMVARIKVMSSTMSIAEKRIPQDGRIEMDLKDGANRWSCVFWISPPCNWDCRSSASSRTMKRPLIAWSPCLTALSW